MGLRDKLENGSGSPLSRGNGTNPPIPVGATNSSKLQYEYSINGNPNIPFNGYFSNYEVKPAPSLLDLNGVNPTSPNRDGNVLPINNSFSNGTYRNSAPPEGVGRI